MDSNVVSFDSMSESGHGDWILPSADCCSRVTMLWLGEKSAPGPFYKAEHVKGAFRKLKQLHMRDYFVGDDLDDPDVAEYWDRKRRITREWAQHNLEVGYHMGQ